MKIIDAESAEIDQTQHHSDFDQQPEPRRKSFHIIPQSRNKHDQHGRNDDSQHPQIGKQTGYDQSGSDPAEHRHTAQDRHRLFLEFPFVGIIDDSVFHGDFHDTCVDAGHQHERHEKSDSQKYPYSHKVLFLDPCPLRLTNHASTGRSYLVNAHK